METKKYVGYLNLGASTKYEAITKHGIQLYFTNKPNWFRRILWYLLLNGYWVNEK